MRGSSSEEEEQFPERGFFGYGVLLQACSFCTLWVFGDMPAIAESLRPMAPTYLRMKINNHGQVVAS